MCITHHFKYSVLIFLSFHVTSVLQGKEYDQNPTQEEDDEHVKV